MIVIQLVKKVQGVEEVETVMLVKSLVNVRKKYLRD